MLCFLFMMHGLSSLYVAVVGKADEKSSHEYAPYKREYNGRGENVRE